MGVFIKKPGKLTVDDIDGLRVYQENNNLKIDGVYGTQTHNFMLSERLRLKSTANNLLTEVIKLRDEIQKSKGHAIIIAVASITLGVIMGAVLGNL